MFFFCSVLPPETDDSTACVLQVHCTQLKSLSQLKHYVHTCAYIKGLCAELFSSILKLVVAINLRMYAARYDDWKLNFKMT